MRMVRVQENRVVIFLMKNPHCCRSFPHTHEGALAFGEPHDDRHVECAGRFEDRLQPRQVGDIEMANGDFALTRFAQHFAKCFHNTLLLRLQRTLLPPLTSAILPLLLYVHRCSPRIASTRLEIRRKVPEISNAYAVVEPTM